MPFLIDGHNLIPRVPGLSLQDVEDELALVEILQAFCRREKKRVEVYFDNAPPGSSGIRKFGSVKAVFVRQGGTADRAIRSRLKRLGGDARNWRVVSSDHEVATAAEAAGAKVISSEHFATQLGGQEGEDQPSRADPHLSESELAEWLDFFDGES